MPIISEEGARIGLRVHFAGSATVGFCSSVGHGDPSAPKTYIGAGVHIGAFCIVEPGATLEEDVEVDHYCRIGSGSRIGRNTRILYGAQVFDDVVVGNDCIIGGHLIDRTIVEDKVTYSGDMAHLHADPTGDWDETAEPSPRILYGSVVGVGALIVGSVSIGPRAYVAAGETVRTDIPEETVLLKGKLKPLSAYQGFIKVRGKTPEHGHT